MDSTNLGILLNCYCGEGNGTPLQYSCLENPTDGGAWWAAVHGVARSQTRLSDFPFTFHFHALEKEMATHSSILAWRIPGTGEPVGLPSLGLQSRTRLKWLSSSSSKLLFLSHSVMFNPFVTPWIVACQSPLSMGFPRQGYWSGLPFPPPGIFWFQRSNPCLLLGRSLLMSHLASPCIKNNVHVSEFRVQTHVVQGSNCNAMCELYLILIWTNSSKAFRITISIHLNTN